MINMKNINHNQNTLSQEQGEQLLNRLEARFLQNKHRHAELNWTDVQVKLVASPQKLWSLNEMERTGGEPDLVAYDLQTEEFTFYDCSPESPEGRRSVCYDHAALEARKKNKPADSALNLAAEMGVEILTEEQYRLLQALGEYDLKTSSWLKTPPAIRKLGGAIFGDRRYDHVFIYHNGADSYYAARGFRGSLRV